MNNISKQRFFSPDLVLHVFFPELDKIIHAFVFNFPGSTKIPNNTFQPFALWCLTQKNNLLLCPYAFVIIFYFAKKSTYFSLFEYMGRVQRKFRKTSIEFLPCLDQHHFFLTIFHINSQAIMPSQTWSYITSSFTGKWKFSQFNSMTIEELLKDTPFQVKESIVTKLVTQKFHQTLDFHHILG